MSETDVKAISRRRGVAAEFNTFTTGLVAELTVNLTNMSLMISDGEGSNFEAARADMLNVNQLDIVKRGIADNALQYTIVDFTYDEATGKVVQVKKSADQIKSQLTSAYIADKDLSNVPVNVLANKGLAKQFLQNVPFTALSWDNTITEHWNTKQVDITGGGVVFRNLTNVKTETFDNVPSFDSNLTGNGLSYKSLKNSVGVLTLDTINELQLANKYLTNINYNDMYGKDTILDYSKDKGCYILKRDLSNIDGSQVNKSDLTRASIATKDLSNIEVLAEDKHDVVERIGAASVDFFNVDRSVLTDVEGNIALMSYDASNADKEILFKGNKNLLINGNFTIKHSHFIENKDLELNEVARLGDVFYYGWVALNSGARLASTDSEVLFVGSWYQAIPWTKDFLKINELYLSIDNNCIENFNCYLAQPKENDLYRISNKCMAVDDFVLDKNYNRRGCKFVINKNSLIENSPIVLVLECVSGTTAGLRNLQLEKNNISNFENINPSLQNALIDSRTRKVVKAYFVDELPVSSYETCYKLVSNFSEDENYICYVKRSDFEREIVVPGSRVPVGTSVYIKADEKLVFYTVAMEGEFNFDSYEEELVVEDINLYENNALLLLKTTNYIYTFSNDGFYLLFDPIPNNQTIYLDVENSENKLYIWDDIKSEMKELTSGSGSNVSGTNLPLFFHVLSDRNFNQIGWVDSYTFSERNASVYQDAYQYLLDQLHPVGRIISGGTLETKGEDIGNVSTWYIDWSDNKLEDTNVSLSLTEEEALQALIYKIEYLRYEYEFIGPQSIANLVVRRSLPVNVENNIEFFRSYDGLKIVIENEDAVERINSVYNDTGYAWYYLIHEDVDIKNAYFRLPRVIGYAIESGEEDNLGNVEAEHVKTLVSSPSMQAIVKEHLYFYLGASKINKEEIFVNKIVNSLTRINNKKDNVVYTNLPVKEKEEDYFGENECEYVVVVDNKQPSYSVIIPKDKYTARIRLDLSFLLGVEDPVYNEETKTYTFSAGSFSNYTQFNFEVVLDLRQCEEDIDISFINAITEETISAPVLQKGNLYFLNVRTFIKPEYVDIDNVDVFLKREMFDFRIKEI